MTGTETATATGGGACVHSSSEPATRFNEEGHTCQQTKVGSPRSEAPLLAEDSPAESVPEEIVGCTLAEAVSVYKAHRKGEAANERFSSGTLHGRAQRRYAALLNADRKLRQAYDNPTVAMLTLVGQAVSDGEWIPPVEHTEAVTDPLNNFFATLRHHLGGYDWEYAAVRGATKQGVSHWHILLWIDGNPSLDTFAPAVKGFINNSDVSESKQHPLGEAIKVNTTPSEGLNPIGKMDRERGTVSQFTRYVATQLPHVSPVRELSDAEAMQGAIEWAARSQGFRTSSGIRITDSEAAYLSQDEKEGGERGDSASGTVVSGTFVILIYDYITHIAETVETDSASSNDLRPINRPEPTYNARPPPRELSLIPLRLRELKPCHL